MGEDSRQFLEYLAPHEKELSRQEANSNSDGHAYIFL
jgi:hypothetical protein